MMKTDLMDRIWVWIDTSGSATPLPYSARTRRKLRKLENACRKLQQRLQTRSNRGGKAGS